MQNDAKIYKGGCWTASESGKWIGIAGPFPGSRGGIKMYQALIDAYSQAESILLS